MAEFHDGQFIGPCYHCKTDMWLPRALYEAAKHSTSISFYCAYGHGQIFAKGETELDKMRRERDRLAQQIAMKDDLIAGQKAVADKAIRELAATKAASIKARKRSAAGTCPCCNRTFRQMALHIKNQHPNFRAEQAA